MRLLLYIGMVMLSLVSASCSDSDYLNAIPRNSSLVMAIDVPRLSGAGNGLVLQAALLGTEWADAGVDLTVPVYLFEDVQGRVGLCARVTDAEALADVLEAHGVKAVRRGAHRFVVLPDRRMAAWSERSALLMGPVAVGDENRMVSLMTRWLNAGENHGGASGRLMQTLDELDAPITMVCQAQALPDELTAPLTIGAPKGTDASAVMLAAEMEVKDSCLWISGRPFSYHSTTDRALKAAAESYRPITGRYVSGMEMTDVMGLFVNVDGKTFLSLLRRNRGLRTMLMGVNTAIDMDNIIKSVDGDMALITPETTGGGFRLRMAARLGHADWLKDVDYWKRSVPAGGRIEDRGERRFDYTDGVSHYYFGVTEDLQYMSGGSEAEALRSIGTAHRPLPADIVKAVTDKKMAMVINMAAFQKHDANALSGFLAPVLGRVRTMVYMLNEAD